LKARVIISRWGDRPGAHAERTVLDVITADGGRYRQVYDEPEAARGRVVVSDGTTLWQYEPSRQTVLQRPAPPSTSDLLDDPVASPLERILEEGTITIAGRPTRAIALRPRGSATVRERLWVDAATGRSLKTETFAPSGRLVRRVEMVTVAFPPSVDESAFRPDFPPTARTLMATTEQPSDAEAEARRLNLPLKADGYRLRNALRPAVARTGSAASRPTTHLLYSDGAHAMSVFVTEDFATQGKALTPKAKPGWLPIVLEDGRTAFTQEQKSPNNHTATVAAVVWTGASHRYTAMAHVPLSELLPTARILAAATSVSRSPAETASQ
jgi:outer membrane lipoprotein-sorting protein